MIVEDPDLLPPHRHAVDDDDSLNHAQIRRPSLKALAYAQSRRFDVRFEIPHAVQLDGDSFGSIVAARITVRPAALQVCTGGPRR